MRWVIWLALSIALLGVSFTARAHQSGATLPIRALPHHTECPVKLPKDFWDEDGSEKFKASEEWAWEKICLGERADMRYAPDGEGSSETCKPTEIENAGETIPQYRKLRPVFLELVLSREPWVSTLRRPTVSIACGSVEGAFYLDDYTVSPHFQFYHGKVDGAISLVGARFNRNLSIQNSVVTGEIQARHLTIGGNLYLNRGSFTEVNMRGSKINGGFFLVNSAVRGQMDATGIETAGDLYLYGSVFTDIRLFDANIGGTVSLSRATVTRRLDAAQIEVGADLWLHGGGMFAEIDLRDANIRGDVRLAGSTFTGVIDAVGSRILGELHVSSNRLGVPIWTGHAGLLLRNASVDAIHVKMSAWRMPENGTGYLPIDLTGFIYNRFGTLQASDGISMGEEKPAHLINWIEVQLGHGSRYDPQPFEQLAKVLDEAGATDKARQIRYAKFEYKVQYDRNISAIEKIWLQLLKWTVGYGEYPFQIFHWLILLWLIGGIVALFSFDNRVCRIPENWMFSLENTIFYPELVKFIRSNKKIDHNNIDHGLRWVERYFYFQRILVISLTILLMIVLDVNPL